MTAPPSVRISTFWGSLALTILLAAGGNYILLSNKLSVLETQVTNFQDQLSVVSLRQDAIQQQVVTRTDDRFRRADWEREEAQIQAQFLAMQKESGRKFDRIEEKLDVIMHRLIGKDG